MTGEEKWRERKSDDRDRVIGEIEWRERKECLVREGGERWRAKISTDIVSKYWASPKC